MQGGHHVFADRAGHACVLQLDDGVIQGPGDIADDPVQPLLGNVDALLHDHGVRQVPLQSDRGCCHRCVGDACHHHDRDARHQSRP